MLVDIFGSCVCKIALISTFCYSFGHLWGVLQHFPKAFFRNCVSDVNACVVGSWSSTAVSALQGEDLSEEEALALAMQVRLCMHSHHPTCLLLFSTHLRYSVFRACFLAYGTDHNPRPNCCCGLEILQFLISVLCCLTLLKKELGSIKGMQASLADEEKAAPGPSHPSAWLSAP